MSAEPTRPIEEQLRAYAQTRRAQAPERFDLHPATRRWLQSEVARAYAAARAPEPAPRVAWRWQALWPRFAVALGLLVVLTVAMIQFWPVPEERSLQLAKQLESELAPTSGVALSQTTPSAVSERKVAELAAPAAAEPARAPVTPLPTSARPSLSEARDGETALASRSAASPRAEAPPVAGAAETKTQPATETPARQYDRLMMERYGLRPSQTARPAPPTTQNAPTAAPLAEVPGRTDTPTAAAVPATETVQAWRFAQVDRYRRNPNSPPVPPVLRAFQVIRQGSRLTIIDADGSVYLGDLQGAAEPALAGVGADQRATAPPATRGIVTSPAKPRADAPAPEASAVLSSAGRAMSAPTSGVPSDLRFTVTGTHRTTQKRVVFQGVLSESLEQRESITPAPAPGTSATESKTRAVYGAGQTGAAFPSRLQIKGEAIVGDTTRLGVEAVRVGD